MMMMMMMMMMTMMTTHKFQSDLQELAARKGFSQALMKAFKDGQKLQLNEARMWRDVRSECGLVV